MLLPDRLPSFVISAALINRSPDTLSTLLAKAVEVAVEIGFNKSVVLSTFANPTIVLSIPETVPVKAGALLITTFPLPVISFDTIFLLASVNKAFEAVVVDKTGAAKNVLAPLNV